MLGSRYLAQFESEVTGWNRELGATAEVLVQLTEIQRTWSYLEPLFIGSDEVKKELPETAERFAGIDVDVKKMLKKAWATRRIKAACNEPGLLGSLESTQSQLDICKKSLADFLDGRRRQFPRFYFTSEADLLDILSNGSQPAKIMVHVSKIYLSTKTFELDEKGGKDGRPAAAKWIAGVGSEDVQFEPAVPLDGKVEVYLQTVLDGFKKTMFNHTVRSIDRYHQMERMEWVMHGGKAPSDMAQVILLVAAINYADDLEQKVFPGIAKGKADAMQVTGARLVDGH
jgi:dynein heavy chain